MSYAINVFYDVPFEDIMKLYMSCTSVGQTRIEIKFALTIFSIDTHYAIKFSHAKLSTSP
jgi:hypothetical protein